MKSESTRLARITMFEVGGEEFVVVPRAEYERLRGLPTDTVDAVAFGMRTLGRSLRLAREEAGYTQAELAKKLRRSQSMVSSAETGTLRVGQRYVLSVLAACRLPEDWKPPRAAQRSSSVARRKRAAS